MPDYAKTIIYKLINYDCPDLVYVGSTTNFTKRKQTHKCYSKISKIKLYETIRKNGGWESWVMIKICDYPCLSSIEARQEEDRHMIELKANLNSIKAQRTVKQYAEDNKDEIAKRHKQRYQDNKDKIKQYNKDNKDKIKQYNEDNKDKKKQYYLDNKEKISEQKRQKYLKKKAEKQQAITEQ